MRVLRLSVWVLAAALLGGAAGCDKLGLGSGDPSAKAEADDDDAPKKKKKKGDDDEAPKTPTATAQLTFQAPTAPTGPGLPLGPSPTPPPAGAVDYFGADAATIPARLKERFPAGVRTLDILVYATYVFTNVQDAAQKMHVDRYQLRDGRWQEPTPVKLFGDLKTEADIAAVTFDPNEVAFGEIARLVKDAPTHLKVETPSVTLVSIKRLLPFEKEVRIRVFVSGPRSNGFVEYDNKGAFLKADD